MNDFPIFFLDTNDWWGVVNSLTKLQEAIGYQWGPSSLPHVLDAPEGDILNGMPRFGRYREHQGKRTLRQYLEAHGVDLSTIR